MKRLLIICILILSAILISGCTNEGNTETHINSNSVMSNKQIPTDEVIIDLELLRSQGWKIEEYPEFYHDRNFMHNENFIGSIFLNLDQEGNAIGITAVTNLDFIKTHSITVNGVTFKNFVSDDTYKFTFDLNNPNDKNVQYSISTVRYYVPGWGSQEPHYEREVGRDEKVISRSFNEILLNDVSSNVHPNSLFILYVGFLPTYKREKIIQKTDWLSLDYEHKIKLSDSETDIMVKQLRPSGELEITSNVDGINSYENTITISFEFKAEDGTINGFDNTYGKRYYQTDLFNLNGKKFPNNYIPIKKIVAWRATIEEHPIVR